MLNNTVYFVGSKPPRITKAIINDLVIELNDCLAVGGYKYFINRSPLSSDCRLEYGTNPDLGGLDITSYLPLSQLYFVLKGMITATKQQKYNTKAIQPKKQEQYDYVVSLLSQLGITVRSYNMLRHAITKANDTPKDSGEYYDNHYKMLQALTDCNLTSNNEQIVRHNIDKYLNL